MGIRLTIGGAVYNAIDYTVNESVNSLAGGDSTGGTGSIDFTIQRPDPDLLASHPLVLVGANYLIDKEVSLTDTDQGETMGRVVAVDDSSGATISVSCDSRLNLLNVYNIQSQPFVGTLQNAFTYYLSLAGVTTSLFVDESIRNRSVVFPGFEGELWFNLKQMAQAQFLDLALVSNIILLRPARQRTAIGGYDISRNHDTSAQSTAQAVEVYRYDNTAVTNAPVYPPGGWNPDVEIITVGAGESIEQELELSASLTSIVQPTMQTFVAQGYDSGSVYTIVADDGLPVDPSLWSSRGGSLRVAINPDTTSLTVYVTGARNIPVVTGGEDGYSKTFSVALASDASGNRYSTLRILGTGVAYSKEKVTFPTGLTPQQTATEIGLTIDNPFVTSLNQMYELGIRAAEQFAGQVPTVSGSVTKVNQLGESGSARYPTYAAVQSSLAAQGATTYAQVQTLQGSKSYEQIQQEWFDSVRNEFANQVFGNVAGVRIWDKRTRRFYRVQNGKVNADRIDFSEASNDLSFSDVQERYSGLTYAQVQGFNSGLTYKDSFLAGVIGV